MHKILSWKASQKIKGAQFDQEIETIYKPLAEKLLAYKAEKGEGRLVVGITAPQGSGKSTLSSLLKLLLEQQGYKVVVVSIDDLYLPFEEREKLKKISPLFDKRGAPGTHDTELGIQIFKQLKAGEATEIPRFDKAAANGKGDRAPKDQWEKVAGPVDFVFLEGWFVGANSLSDEALAIQYNDTEKKAGATKWKTHWNEQLKGPYATLFSTIDRMISISPPSFDQVFINREEQERKLRETLADLPGDQRQGRSAMSKEQVQEFVEHFESLTRWTLTPGNLVRSDIRIQIDADRRVEHVVYTD